MIQPVSVPFLGANDTECVLVQWRIENGDRVKSGDVLCVVETTKATIDIEVDQGGFAYRIAAEGARLHIGSVTALLSHEPLADPAAAIAEVARAAAPGGQRRMTRKAELLIARHRLVLAEVEAYAQGKVISEEVVLALVQQRGPSERLRGLVSPERVAVVGGVSGGGALIIIDALRRQCDCIPAYVFDQDAAFHGRQLMGVPIVGSSVEILEWWRQGRFESAVIAFNRDLEERARTYRDLVAHGVRFRNVIDVTADVRSGVILGSGNVILGHAYIGACTEVGDNNFVSANVCLEHGNKIGSHCGFGPGVMTSGNVTIGDEVRFGAGIFVEPGLRIGHRAKIASGSVLTADVPDERVVRARVSSAVASKRV
jgi:acetyltransferase-like isoleucine patch superfamily enzyme